MFNPTPAEVNIGGWFLTDDPNAPRKYRIRDGTRIPASGFVVFAENQFNPTPGLGNSFSLSSHGEQIYLFSGDVMTNLTGYSHGFNYGGAANGVTFGRYLNSVGEEQYPAQLSNTLGRPNSGPRVGPLVINEIHYHPAPGGDEFVELKNITANSVPLFDSAHPTNAWLFNGLGYTFPTNTTLEANGLIVLVATNPVLFRAKYGVPTNVPVLGPYSGTLQVGGERLRLQRPDTPDNNGLPYITVDEVHYNKAQWPTAADGGGLSLQRIAAAAYGNDPINWQAADPTPGQETVVDTDGDGVPDWWEIAHDTDRLVADADADPDGDSLTNMQEYIAGTDPHDEDDALRLFVGRSVVPGEALTVTLCFEALANRSYAVLYCDNAPSPGWTNLVTVAPEPGHRWMTITNVISPKPLSRFFRLTTPSRD